MITLTTPIPVPNGTRIRAEHAQFIEDANSIDEMPSETGPIALVKLRVMSSPANNRSKLFRLVIRNGLCDGIRKSTTATAFDGDVEMFAITSATAYDQIEAAYRGAGGRAAALKAVETALLTLGIIDATLTGTVS